MHHFGRKRCIAAKGLNAPYAAEVIILTKTVPLAPEESCGCGSGLKYRDCCWDKQFRWEKSRNGDSYKKIPNSPKARESFETLEVRFREIFGRKPQARDTIYVDSFFYSYTDYWRSFGEAGERAQIPPNLLFASLVTERMVTAETREFLTDAELGEWDEVFDIYDEVAQKHDDPYFFLRNQWPADIQSLLDAVYGSIIIIINSTHNHTPKKAEDGANGIRSYLIMRSQEVARAVYRSIDGRYSEESLILLRVIYETSLNLYFLRKNPEKYGYFQAHAGLANGSHRITPVQVNGRKRRMIENIGTGELFPMSISWHERISYSDSDALIELHQSVYGMFSAYAHSGIDPAYSLLNSELKIAVHRSENVFEAIQWLPIVQTWLIDSMLAFDDLTSAARRDLQFARRKLATEFKAMLSKGPPLDAYGEPFRSAAQLVINGAQG